MKTQQVARNYRHCISRIPFRNYSNENKWKSYRQFAITSFLSKYPKSVLATTTSVILYAAYYQSRNSEHNSNLEQQSLPLPLSQESHNPDNKPLTFNTTEVARHGREEESMREKFNFIDKVVRKCASSVFYLEIRDRTKRDPETGDNLITSNGSGFLISQDGWALTNAHVVLNRPQTTILAFFRNGNRYPVQVEDVDVNMDLALLKINSPEKLPALEFGEDEDVSVGEWVVALGSPLSLSNSVTVGIISSVDRPAKDLGLKNYSMTYIQTDASITFGNSGGPLVNLDGNVIGINNLRLTSGISFAIPVAYAKRFLQNTMYRKSFERQDENNGKHLFGMTTISVNLDIINELLRENKSIPEGLNEGLLVWKLLNGTPAQKSGLQEGDIITHVNGVPVKEPQDVYTLSKDMCSFTAEAVRNGKKITINFENN